MTGKKGPAALKYTCAICQKDKWCVDFPEGCFSKCHPGSICTDCILKGEIREAVACCNELKDLFTASEEKSRALENKLQTLETQHALQIRRLEEKILELASKLEAQSAQARDESPTDLGGSADVTPAQGGETALAVPLLPCGANEKKKKKKKKKDHNAAQPSVEDSSATGAHGKVEREEEKRETEEEKTNEEKKNKMRKKKKKNAEIQEESGKSLPRGKNKSPADKCARVTLIGDSQARGLQSLLAARLRTSVKVSCLPGCGNHHIRVEAEKSQISESSVVALMVSGNDLYLRGGRVGPTDKILHTVMGAVDDCGLKTRKRVVVGMLRRGPTRTAHSMNVSLNRRLADLCTAGGVFFVDP